MVMVGKLMITGRNLKSGMNSKTIGPIQEKVLIGLALVKMVSTRKVSIFMVKHVNNSNKSLQAKLRRRSMNTTIESAPK